MSETNGTGHVPEQQGPKPIGQITIVLFDNGQGQLRIDGRGLNGPISEGEIIHHLSAGIMRVGKSMSDKLAGQEAPKIVEAPPGMRFTNRLPPR